MKKINYKTTVLSWLLLATVTILYSNNLLAENTPAFPGAEGFGRYTTGGRGGAVYHVTSLADDGSTGTLRWALNKSGKRTIVFDVSGTIHLTSPMKVENGFVTIAGQTAPGDGICIADYPFTVNSSNVIIRFMRFRLGNLQVAYHEGDGLGAMDQENIIIDHCSVSWSIDECCSVLGNKNATVQWCIVSQSLKDAGHVKGSHGYGGNWGGSGTSYHHNLLCHHDSRTPRLGPRVSTQTDERLDMRNNVIYNWGGNGCYGGEGMNVNMVKNYYKPGPGTKQKSSYIQYRIAAIGIRTTSYITTYPAYAPMWHIWGDYYVSENYVYGHSDVTADNWTKGIYEQINNASVDYTFTQETKDTMRIDSPIDFIYTTTHTPQKAYEKVLDYAGCSLSRDWVDTLMVYDTRNGVATNTGAGNIYGIIDTQEDNKPATAGSEWYAWPTLNSTSALTDTDQDGMPDDWETANNLNPSDANDRNTFNSDGYTMLEVYLNSLINHIMEGGLAEGTGQGYTLGNEETSIVTISQSSYIGTAGAASPWLFDGGYSITNNNGKGYATGAESGIKFSTGVKFTVNIPSGLKVLSVNFTGYDNYDSADSYLSELNGTSFGSTDYVFTKKDANGNYVICSHDIDFSAPVSDSFTFTFAGNQVVLKIGLTITSATGIETKTFEIIDQNKLVNVYDIYGRIIRSHVKLNRAANGLPNGIYIIDRQKVAIYK